MSFLTVNGIEVKTLDARATPQRVGEYDRADDGRARSSVRNTYYDWQMRTGPLTEERARAVAAWIEGEGHAISFEDGVTTTAWTWTSRGRGFYLNTPPGSATRVDTDARWGSSFLRLADSLSSLSWLVLDADGSSPWTAILWRKETSGGPWVHYMGWSDGTVARNGVVADAAAHPVDDWIRRAASPSEALVLRDFGAHGVADYDDVVLLPYHLPTEWAPEVYAFHSTQAWPALPKVQLAGTRFPSSPLAIAETGEVATWEHWVGGTWVVGDSFDFTLRLTE